MKGQTPGLLSYQHTTVAMSVSQSPDSVTAASDDAGSSTTTDVEASLSLTAESNDLTPSSLNGVVDIAPTAAAAASSSFVPRRAKANVINPYLKTAAKAPVILDPILAKRKKFVEKYRAQALHHSRRRRDSRSTSSEGWPGVPSVSALELRDATKQWRCSWRTMSVDNAESSLLRRKLNRMPLRPRLFLFGRNHVHANQQRQSSHPSQIQHNKQNCTNEVLNREDQRPTNRQQQDGVWEIGEGITELSGEGGSGKTQICLSLCVTCAMTPLLFPPSETRNAPAIAHQNNAHDNHYTSIYVTMGEGISSVTIAVRLEKMIRARLKRVDPDEITHILSRIGLVSIRNEEEFVEFVEQNLPHLLASQNRPAQHRHPHQPTSKIGLLAFDGIAGFFRFSDPLFQHSKNSMFNLQRSFKLLQISSTLRKLSDMYDVPMLITNQVSACISPTNGSGGSSSETMALSSSLMPEQEVIPALGLVWSNCVSTRIILQRTDGRIVIPIPGKNKENRKVVRVRKARILQSVNMPREWEVWYAIDTGEVTALA